MRRDEWLDQVTVESPCPVDWDAMEGDDRNRFCRECGQSVVDLSALRRDDAAALVAGAGDSLCGRITRLRDGSVLTRIRPRLRFNLRSMLSLIAWIAAYLGFLRFLVNYSPTVVHGKIRMLRPAPVVLAGSLAPAPGDDEEELARDCPAEVPDALDGPE